MQAFLEEVTPKSKREMLRSALRLFVRKGFAATTVRDIAEDSGFTNPALFKHYPTVQALAQDLYDAAYRRMAQVLWAEFPSESTPRRQLKVLLSRCSQLLDEELELFLFVHENVRAFWPQVPPDVRERSLIRLLIQLLKDDPPESAKVVVAALVGFLGQFARMLYFDEFPGGVSEWGVSMERMALVIMKGAT
jgi:AcrR family transcriptional regulator